MTCTLQMIAPVQVIFLLFFFRLRAHNQRVDHSGAYNWGCSLLSGFFVFVFLWGVGVGGGCCRKLFPFDTLDTKASRVGASTTSMGNEFQSLIFLEGGASILGSGGQQGELLVMGASLT